MKPPLHCGKKKRQTDPSRNRRTDEVPFIAACCHFTRKNTGFVLRLPPQNKAHATFMQPLQCVSQHDVANLHLSTHITTPDDNSHAAIPMRSATTDSKTPYDCANKHTQSSLKPPLQCGKRKKANRPQPHPPHRRGTFHRRLQPLYTEKHKVSCSGFLPKTKPMQHSCNHCNAFRSMTSQTCTYLHT